MLQNNKIDAFVALGHFLSQFSESGNIKNPTVVGNDIFFNQFIQLIELSQSHNGWFTPSQVGYAIQSWATALQQDNLKRWLLPYNINVNNPKNIALILAGNIPLVGFHDFMTVLITGHNAIVKTSSNDQKLLPFLAKYLIHIEPSLQNNITFVTDNLTNYHAVIATGSNNTARYFEYYFKDKPSIIRKTRNSVAILNGKETKTDLINLGEDIFRYFGLGCRSVSKIFVPQNYDFTLFFEAIYTYASVINYQKYANNYDYNKAVFLMSLFKLLDNEFLLLKEDSSYASPIGCLFYQYYDNLDDLKNKLDQDSQQIQCIVSNQLISNSIPFGFSQKPLLSDYADGIDTVAFLTQI